MTETQQKYCEQCGARLSEGVRFCEQCGAQVPSASVTAPQSSTSTPATEDVPDVTPSPSTPKAAASVSPALAWETGVSILGNPLIRKQMVLVVLISGGFMALLLSFIVAVSGDADQ